MIRIDFGMVFESAAMDWAQLHITLTRIAQVQSSGTIIRRCGAESCQMAR